MKPSLHSEQMKLTASFHLSWIPRSVFFYSVFFQIPAWIIGMNYSVVFFVFSFFMRILLAHFFLSFWSHSEKQPHSPEYWLLYLPVVWSIRHGHVTWMTTSHEQQWLELGGNSSSLCSSGQLLYVVCNNIQIWFSICQVTLMKKSYAGLEDNCIFLFCHVWHISSWVCCKYLQTVQWKPLNSLIWEVLGSKSLQIWKNICITQVPEAYWIWLIHSLIQNCCSCIQIFLYTNKSFWSCQLKSFLKKKKKFSFYICLCLILCIY